MFDLLERLLGSPPLLFRGLWISFCYMSRTPSTSSGWSKSRDPPCDALFWCACKATYPRHCPAANQCVRTSNLCPRGFWVLQDLPKRRKARSTLATDIGNQQVILKLANTSNLKRGSPVVGINLPSHTGKHPKFGSIHEGV